MTANTAGDAPSAGRTSAENAAADTNAMLKMTS